MYMNKWEMTSQTSKPRSLRGKSPSTGKSISVIAVNVRSNPSSQNPNLPIITHPISDSINHHQDPGGMQTIMCRTFDSAVPSQLHELVKFLWASQVLKYCWRHISRLQL
ncbi:hypothetical protein AKJ16_DCAP24876 [Drosera capensis]